MMLSSSGATTSITEELCKTNFPIAMDSSFLIDGLESHNIGTSATSMLAVYRYNSPVGESMLGSMMVPAVVSYG